MNGKIFGGIWDLTLKTGPSSNMWQNSSTIRRNHNSAGSQQPFTLFGLFFKKEEKHGFYCLLLITLSKIWNIKDFILMLNCLLLDLKMTSNCVLLLFFPISVLLDQYAFCRYMIDMFAHGDLYTGTWTERYHWTFCFSESFCFVMLLEWVCPFYLLKTEVKHMQTRV